MAERKWAMTKIGPGDWLCLSNDKRTVWRFHKHVDGTAHGLECDYYERTFWRAVYMPVEVFEADVERWVDPSSAWAAEWREAGWYLPTRSAAIERMERADA